MGEKTPKKQLPEALKKNIWVAGKSGNPNGRPKGARAKFSEAFCHDLLKEWEEGGIEVMQRVRQEDPATFLRVAASIIPKEFTFSQEDSTFDRIIEDFSDGEISELINGLKAIGTSEEVRERALQEGITKQLN